MLKNIYNSNIYYTMSNIHKGESVISTNEMRKGIMNNNMKMKNTEYKMDKKNIVYIMKGNKT